MEGERTRSERASRRGVCKSVNDDRETRTTDQLRAPVTFGGRSRLEPCSLLVFQWRSGPNGTRTKTLSRSDHATCEPGRLRFTRSSDDPMETLLEVFPRHGSHCVIDVTRASGNIDDLPDRLRCPFACTEQFGDARHGSSTPTSNGTQADDHARQLHRRLPPVHAGPSFFRGL